jgi:hypothetical protein
MRSDTWLDRTPLRSQGLGVFCGLATVVLLGVGSFVLVATEGGASAGVHMDDLRAFFTRPALAHLWLYLLIPVFGLYGLNTALATAHSLVHKIGTGVRSVQAYGPPVMHVSFLLALVAHLVGGVYGREIAPLVITTEWTTLGDGRDVRLSHIESEMLPSGMPKVLRAHVEVRRGEQVTPSVIGYNEPLSEGFGARLFLLEEAGRLPGPRGGRPAIRVHGRAAPGNPWALGSAVLLAIGVVMMGRRLVPKDDQPGT